jgi:hypothetical protein
LPQARCGRFEAPQFGQVLRAVRPTRHAEALRLRLFDLDIFRFGTAMMRSCCAFWTPTRLVGTTTEG